MSLHAAADPVVDRDGLLLFAVAISSLLLFAAAVSDCSCLLCCYFAIAAVIKLLSSIAADESTAVVTDAADPEL